MLIPTGTSMLYRAYGPEQRAKVARTLILPILIGPAAAPILGGVLTQTLSWRWVFLINVPLGMVMVAFAYLYLPEHRPSPNGRLDIRGMLLSGLGLSALLYAISEGSVVGWAAPQILVSGLGGIALLWVFARGALRAPDPILRVRLLREPLLRATNMVFVLTTGVFLASLYLTPIFLQQALGQSPIQSGTTTFVEAIGVGVAAQTIGRLYPRLGPRVLGGCGAIALTVYMALFVLVAPGVNIWLLRGLMFFGGVGNAGSFLSIQTSMFTHISSAGHRTCLGDLQHRPPIVDRARHRRADHGRRGCRRHPVGLPRRLSDRGDPHRDRRRAGVDADQHRLGPLDDEAPVQARGARARGRGGAVRRLIPALRDLGPDCTHEPSDQERERQQNQEGERVRVADGRAPDRREPRRQAPTARRPPPARSADGDAQSGRPDMDAATRAARVCADRPSAAAARHTCVTRSSDRSARTTRRSRSARRCGRDVTRRRSARGPRRRLVAGPRGERV